MGKIAFLLSGSLFLLLSCNQSPNSLRLLSDSPWLWKATELYNRERSGQKPLIILDYQKNIRSWLVNPAYKRANIVVSDQAIVDFGLNYLPLELPDIVDKEIYPQLESYRNDYFAPIFFEMPLYLIPKSKKWENIHILSFKTVFEMTAGQASAIEKSFFLRSDLLQLSPHLTPQLQTWRREIEQLESLQVPVLDWYLQLQKPNPALPIVPISLEDYDDFSKHGKGDYRAILLLDDSLTWVPRKLGLIALNSGQNRKEKLESRKFLNWITSDETQKNLSLLSNTPGMLGGWSIFPKVNKNWVAAKAPELDNIF